MNTRLIKELMKGQSLDALDAVRLVMECVEGVGCRATGMAREELLCLIRRVISAGISAIQAEERTECFEKVAWESVAARANRAPQQRGICGIMCDVC